MAVHGGGRKLVLVSYIRTLHTINKATIDNLILLTTANTSFHLRGGFTHYVREKSSLLLSLSGSQRTYS